MARAGKGVGRRTFIQGMAGAAAAGSLVAFVGQVHGWWVPAWQLPKTQA